MVENTSFEIWLTLFIFALIQAFKGQAWIAKREIAKRGYIKQKHHSNGN